MKSSKSRIALIVAGAVLLAQAPVLLHGVASAAAGTVTGVVFDDQTSDGVRDGSDPGVAGVEVKAYDSAGALVGTTTTVANGTYTLSVTNAAGNDLRVEFTTPVGFKSSMIGTDNRTSIQFVQVGATNVSYGVFNPDLYCANVFASGKQGDGLAATCFQPPNAQNLPSVYLTGWNTRYTKKAAAIANETGTVWGLGYDGVRNLLWTSAFVRRHAPVGPKKLCGIYATDPVTGHVALAFDMKADFGMNCGDDTNYGSNQATTRDLSASSHLSYDNPGYADAGKAGFGDLDVSADGQSLYVVNVHDKKVHRFTIGGTTSAPTLTANGSWAINDNCSTNGSVLRPWALKPLTATTLYVGSVCSNEAATPSTTAAPESATVQLMTITGSNSASWSTAATVDLSYVRGCPHGYDCVSGQVPLAKWKAWTNDFSAVFMLNLRAKMVYPQPILSDIEILDDGSLAVGFMDRFAIQMGYQNRVPDNGKNNATLVEVVVDGDTLILCKSGSTFVQEVDGSCTSDTVTHSAPARTQARENAASPDKEFFDDNYDDYGDSIHPEMSQGGLAVLRGSNQIAISMMDPDDWINQGGVRFLNQTTGSKGGWPYSIVLASDAVANDAGLAGSNLSFSKAGTLGDLEVLCNNAPVEIGNRVWKDLNANGIQDPGEPGIAGVTIKLMRVSDGYQWGSVVTDSDGNYRFSSNITEQWQGNGDAIGGGLVPNEPFFLKVDNAANFTGSGPLAGLVPTTLNALSSSSGLDTSIDSNATTQTSTDWRVAVSAAAPGENNHTYDIGVVSVVSVGNLVFLDSNANGIQDNGETGVAGAVLSLTDMNGNPVTDATGQPVQPITTTSTGAYLFNNLPIGQYKVNITYPDGYGPTVGGQGTTSTDSSTDSATSQLFTSGGQSDLTLDFGLVPAVSVGDYVWYDVNHDGLQDQTDSPLQGVTLTLTKADGTPAHDTAGRLVTTTTTDATGHYTFDQLPFGQYKVTVTPPAGYVATTVGSGTTATDSSTDSAVSVVLNTNGQRDPTLDFGFWGEVSVGDYVWFDANNDGLQDPSDVPLAGVVLMITKEDGSPVRDVSGALVTTTTTDSAGRYSFDHLPFGRYKVTVTPPAGHTATRAGVGAAATDSSTGSSVSVLLDTNGQRDPTLDFGFVRSSTDPTGSTSTAPQVSVGNKVWRDRNGDGLQGPADQGLRGAVLSVFNIDGSRVTDVNGRPVRPVVTDRNGNYMFRGLPPGQYVVRIKYPSGWVPTTPNRTGRGLNSSTRSSKSLVLAAGESDVTLDFGVVTDKRILRLPATR